MSTPRFATQCLHAGQSVDPTTHSRAVPIYATTSYVFDDTTDAADLFALKKFGNVYTRLMNPTTDVLEKRLAALDGGAAALAFASGQSAICAALLTICHAGQNFISATSLYGGTWTLFTQTFKNMGIEVRFFDPHKPEDIAKLVDENTRGVYIESLGNPKNDVADFRKVADAAHAAGVPLIVDNTVMTPYLLRPIEHGADIVVYSTTKFIGGHGTHIGGAVVDSAKFPWAKNPKKWPEFCAEPELSRHGVRRSTAAHGEHRVHHPHAHTLAARHRRGHEPVRGVPVPPGHRDAAFANAAARRKCASRRDVAQQAPAGGMGELPGLEFAPRSRDGQAVPAQRGRALMGFGIKGGKAKAIKFINSVKLLSHLANIGDAKSLVIHPASTTHSQLTEDEQRRAGVNPEYIRLSVGLEDVQDIIDDLDQALKTS
ncbi:MAG: aminotransferase class I/II-fold pyridoxal phosphate-dependent enzyme [Tepidisphaeraceae bacterium]